MKYGNDRNGFFLPNELFQLGLDYIRCFRHICHAPLTMGTFPVSAGADVITPQRRFTRAPQGSASSPWAGVNKYL